MVMSASTGSVQLTIQGLNNADNSLIFNRMIAGLSNPNGNNTEISEISISDTPIFIDHIGGPLYGFYVRNTGALGAGYNIIVEYQYLIPSGGVEIIVQGLPPQAAMLIFAPDGTQLFQTVRISSDQPSPSPVEFAFWS
jgi:hypothetical protein